MVGTSYFGGLPGEETVAPQRQALVIDWGQVLAGMVAGGIITVLLIYGVAGATAELAAAKIRKRK